MDMTVKVLLLTPLVSHPLRGSVFHLKQSLRLSFCFLLAVDEQFEAASVFLFSRTKHMQNKYRQLLLAEAQVRWISLLIFPSSKFISLSCVQIPAEIYHCIYDTILYIIYNIII